MIEEKTEEKLLGVWIRNDLKWSSHIEKLTTELNYVLSVLRRLRSHLNFKNLKSIAEGLHMSRIRYALPVFAAEYLRICPSDSTSENLQRLQKSQNDMLRTLTGQKQSDHARVSDMLMRTGMLSVNQLIAYGMLMDVWKAREFRIPVLGTLLDRQRNDERTLRSDTSNKVSSTRHEAYSMNVEKLWNMSNEKFKNTNLLKVAKSEARKLASSLPI